MDNELHKGIEDALETECFGGNKEQFLRELKHEVSDIRQLARVQRAQERDQLTKYVR